MSNRQTNASALRQVTLGLRLGAIGHEDACEILTALVDAYDLHEATNKIRERRSREEYLASLSPNHRAIYEAGQRDAAIIRRGKEAAERAHQADVAKFLDGVAQTELVQA